MVLYIWGVGVNGPSVMPAIVTYNYAPPAALNAGASDHFLLQLAQGDTAQFDLASPSGDANLFAWDPYNFGAPTWQATAVGADTLAFTAPLDGQYVVSVYGQVTSTYTLTFQRNGAPGLLRAARAPAPNNPNAIIPAARPIFLDPLPQQPRFTVFLPMTRR